MLDKNLICFHVEGNTAKDILQIASALFMQNGYVKETYLDAVIEREKKYPTGLPGDSMNIAIPHTDPLHIIKPGIAVLIPNKPIPFFMMGTSDVILHCELILPLAIKDPSAQIDTLKQMMSVIQNKELLSQIRHSQSQEEMISLLSFL